jgi:hypothetical protein
MMRHSHAPWLAALVLTAACGRSPAPTAAAPAAAPAVAPQDAQHSGITMPHGDHSPHHGGMVLMRDDLHYEVVFDRDGRHHVWFTDALRNDLPASVADTVSMEVARPGAPVETLALAIDDAGESWVASGTPVAGDGVMVTVHYVLDDTPYEIELPFVVSAAP